MVSPSDLRRRVTAAAVIARLRVQRRRAAEYPEFGLFRTHVIAAGDTIDTATSFPADRTDEITFATKVKRTDELSSGLIFEMGSSSLGIAAAVDGNDLYFVAGEEDGNDDGVTLFMANALIGIGAEYRLVFAVRPGDGMAACWVNGRLLGAAVAVGGTLTAWADSGDGSVGAAAEGTVIDRIPVGLRIAPNNFELLAPLSAYRRQRPRYMPTVGSSVVIPPLPGGIFSFDSTLITFDSTTETFDEA